MGGLGRLVGAGRSGGCLRRSCSSIQLVSGWSGTSRVQEDMRKETVIMR
jgi:hypothetical protein